MLGKPSGVQNAHQSRSNAYYKIVAEFHDSEVTYLNFLRTVKEVFVSNLTSSKLLKAGQLRMLFGNLESLINLSQAVIKEIEEREAVHIAFRSLGPFLKLYTAYVSNYRSSQKLFNKLMLRNKFRERIEMLELDESCNGMKLSALLIMPIQRLPRYILLLKRLIAETNSQEEKGELHEVLSQLEDITSIIESCIDDYENAVKLWKVQNELGLRDEIVAPGRRLLKEGLLYKKRAVDQDYAERQFWLFNDMIVYGKRRLGLRPAYEPSLFLPLRQTQVFFDEMGGVLKLKCKSTTIVLTSDSYETLREWFIDFSAAIENCNELRSTLRKESSRQEVRDFRKSIMQRLQTSFFPSSWYKYTYNVSDNLRSSNEAGSTSLASSRCRQNCTLDENILSDSNNCRKRKATAFDEELESVLQKRRLHSGEGNVDVCLRDTAGDFENEGPRSSCVSTDLETGVDETDRSSKNSRTISRCRADVLKRRQTMQPRIKGLNIVTLSATPDSLSESSIDDEPVSVQRELSRRQSSVPWWVEESEPMTFARKPRPESRGIMDRVKSQCALM